MRALATTLFGALLLAAPLDAQEQDAEGSKDHPMVSRFPGYYIGVYDAEDFGSFEFNLGDNDKRVEGKYWRIEYWLKEGAKKGGPLEIGRNYGNTFTPRHPLRFPVRHFHQPEV